MNSAAHTIRLASFQKEFLDPSQEVVSIIGAKGSSKTFIGTMFILQQIDMQPDQQGLVTFNTLQQARDVFHQEVEPMLQNLNWPYSWNETSCNLRVFNTPIHWRSAEDKVVDRVETIVYGWWWGDECSFYPLSHLQTFFSRVRKGKALKRITSMPEDPDHHIYQFIETAIKGIEA